MNNENFCYWLEGFLINKNELTKEEIDVIKEKLKTVHPKVLDYTTVFTGVGLDSAGIGYPITSCINQNVD